MRTKTSPVEGACPTCHRAPHLVPVTEVASQIGYGGLGLGPVVEMAAKAGVAFDFVETPEGPAVEFERAAEMVSAVRTYQENHYAKWDAYRAYLQERKDAAQVEREQAAARERDEAREHARRHQQAWTKNLARKTEEDIAAREAAKAERRGRPMSPEQFFKEIR